MICTVDQDQDQDQDCLTISRSRVTRIPIILHLTAAVAVEVGAVLCSQMQLLSHSENFECCVIVVIVTFDSERSL